MSKPLTEERAEMTHIAPLIRSVTVFLSSAKRVDAIYFEAARKLGQAIARQGWSLVYGGNYIGCMAALADGAREMGGNVIGITPQLFVDENVADTLCDELIVTDTMRQRKHLLEQRGDAFITLPGGIGTFEEFFEIVVARQLGYHRKPVILLNVNDFYTPMLEMLDRGVEQQFIRPEGRRIIQIVPTVEEAIAAIHESA